MIQIYTGEGKGKTTAALGLALRALGQGKKVCLVQFMKKGDFGEIKSFKKLKNMTVRQFGRRSFVSFKKPNSVDRKEAAKGLVFASQAIARKIFNVIILDEINVAISYGLISEGAVLASLKKVPLSTEVVLTGRGARAKLIKRADLVTEMKAVKHYYNQGIRARKGVEY
ncbi:MAG: cob(I)yrinic acid a,c-diamide adenosyltransferase [Patescibacteria group bacterium]